MYKVFIFLSAFIGNVFCNKNATFDYCTHPDCSLKNQHTLCVAVDKQSPRLYASGMTSWMRYQILLLHNRHRDNIAMGLEDGQPPAANMRKMYWDHELEEMAEVWARQCQKRHDECRNTLRFNVLQNVDVRPVVSRVTEAQILADAVGAWYSGSRVSPTDNVFSFKRSNCSSPGGCNAHWYAAAAWASTWRIGCSQAFCTARRRSCVLYRNRRDNLEDLDEETNTTNIPSTSENILRRTKYMTTTTLPPIEDYAKRKINSEESPLHRGIIHSGKGHTKQQPVILAYTICNYGPGGNIEGFPIYDAGTTCSNCPEGTKCGDKTHRGLCTVIGDPDFLKG